MTTDVGLTGAVAVFGWRRKFSKLRDSRRRRGKRHRLVDVVLISLLAMLCGCDDADDIAVWAEARSPMLEEWFGFKHGTPSQDTILRVFALLQPKSLSRMVSDWLMSLRGSVPKGQVAIDGKSLRGSLQRGGSKSAVHIVSAWMSDGGVSLGQVKTHDKSNEVKAIPELLRMLELSDCTISIDAGGCYKTIAEQICSQSAHYLLAVKDNQPTLRHDCEQLFVEGQDERRRAVDEPQRPAVSMCRDVDAGHGRIEERTAYLCRDLGFLSTAKDWPGLTGVGLVKSQTTDKRTGEVSSDSRYYILSDATTTAEDVLVQTRAHWSVESMHWVLDVEFREDASKIYHRRAAENFSLLRRAALSLLKAAPLPKAKKRMSYKNQRKWCDYFPDYMLEVLVASDGKKDKGTA